MSNENVLTPASVLGEEIDAAPRTSEPGDLNDELMAADWWTDEMVARAGIPIVDVPFVSCGGGMGSFVLADYLRISGLPTSAIRILSNIDYPFQTYEYLTKVSQIPRQERLRSDSTGRPDNIWAWPGYSYREARKEKTLFPIWNVLTEPILERYWTPRAGTVFEAVTQEMERIRYYEMLVSGQVRMVRRRYEGGYFTILTPPPGKSPTRRVAFRSQFVHLAVGYPGLKFLPDLQEYRTKYKDYARTVNAYEPHEHLYESLMAQPGTVLVRGGGIVASRVLQRLMQDRLQRGAQTTILHLFRTYNAGPHNKWGFAKRKGAHGFAFQGFNAPKSSWGGQHIEEMKKLQGEARKDLYERTGGAHTPLRKDWLREMKQGREEGWYRTFQGEVTDVRPSPNGVVTMIRSRDGQTGTLEAQYILDCTGLEADIREHRVLADLLDHSGAARNVLGRLDTQDDSFEITGTRSGAGRMYASGSSTYGGAFQGVDTFLGLQLSAQRITDDLASQGLVKRINAVRSLSGWWKWFRHRPI